MVCAQGDRFLDVDSGRDDEYLSAPTQHYTFIFNVLVLMTLFNEVNARRIDSSANVFAGLHRSRMFIVIWTASFVLQVSTRWGGDVNGNIPPILLRTFGYSRPI